MPLTENRKKMASLDAYHNSMKMDCGIMGILVFLNMEH